MSDLASALAIGAEERELVDELQAGSERAFAQLIAQYSHPVYSLIARSLNDPADAADVTQDVFIKVFRSIRSFHGESSLRTWIYRIAVHEASNQRRWWSRHKKQEAALDEPRGGDEGETFSLADILASPEASPFDHAARAQMRVRVEAALAEVPEVFRTVLVLREIEGFGYEEIAEIVECNIGTVKSRLTRGRAALKSALLADPVFAHNAASRSGNAGPVSSRNSTATHRFEPSSRNLSSTCGVLGKEVWETGAR
jgi:RNA polymerase sigma-70 factor, ECF subfamily